MAADPLTPMSLEELRGALGPVSIRLSAADATPDQRAALTDLYHLFLRATPDVEEPPSDLLAQAAAMIGDVPAAVISGLSPRPRTVFRLFEAGALEAAWLVCETSAAGLVVEPTRATTSSGAPRARPRFPLVVHVEAPKVYAWLPGFRDPRYGAPDSCYEINGLVKLRARVETIRVERNELVAAGSASLSLVLPDPDERVRLVARLDDDTRVVAVGRRLRRPDLVTGVGDGLRRSAWSGWAARLDVRKLEAHSGNWELQLDVTHDGVRRAASLGADVSELAARSAAAGVSARRGRVRLAADDDAWRLIVS